MGNGTFARSFGAVVVVVLLVLYSFTVFEMIAAVLDCQQQTSTQTLDDGGEAASSAADCVGKRITEGSTIVVTMVGGMVSALVVAVLGATDPGGSPSRLVLSRDASERSGKIANAIVILYLITWGVTGLAALYVGLMKYPGLSNTLADIGTTWLGIAVAAGYAYFGIKPQ